MNDFQSKLIEVIAGKVLEQGNMTDLRLPEGIGILRWTGWKESWAEMYPHAQIAWIMDRRPGEERYVYYVDLPSMQHGKVKAGGTFDIRYFEGSHQLSEFTTETEIMEWFKEGFALLVGDVLGDNPWLIETPLKRQDAQTSAR